MPGYLIQKLQSVSKHTIKPYRFTIVYYDLYKELQLEDLETYLILDTMLFFATHNSYTKGVTFLHDYLVLSRTTIHSKIRKLIDLGHLVKEDQTYSLRHDIEECFQFYRTSKGKLFLKIFPGLKAPLKLNLYQIALLYLFYSYSRKYGIATACAKCYTQILNVVERQFYNIRSYLETQELITVEKGNIIKLTEKSRKEFVHKIQPTEDCS